ncbi:DUF397 domain-containing protein [Solwaraspora sp. WMMA2056]|uniref:DUF397 domain-containing protein n=1 Tax=Solwaraspora sp. WMMA2056 TaxID=3015161 RepID=UPI00259B3A30|nr:DUF397 domain-containing protein [Solwaraspora sp. WMMA2056]WJK41153.1 DUF397 domain-containing protein [Solwaraspora sp. WMMA2056]
MIDLSTATWRKSSRSNDQGQCVEVADATWRKSSRSNDQGHCVEVADGLGGVVGVRDSKDPSGPVLVVAPASWSAFITATKGGTLTA